MTLVTNITNEVRFRLNDESLPRIQKCLDQLTDEEIWKRPNSQLSSMGNLILHLNGNVRQYVLFGLGDQPDQRNRQSEFDHRDIISKQDLMDQLAQLMTEVSAVLDKLTEEDLNKDYSVQGMPITGFGILMHVVEHFSYHVGQITWYTKLIKNIDMQYYEGKDLNITG